MQDVSALFPLASVYRHFLWKWILSHKPHSLKYIS